MAVVLYHNCYNSRQMKILIHPKIEAVLGKTIFPDLKKGRKDFDLPHTKAVVFWMKHLLTHDPEIINLIKNKTINPKVMITAAYAHDWGYIGLFDNASSNSLQNILERKKLHMKRGSQMIEQLLYTKLSKAFTSTEILMVSHLVLFHDELKKLVTDTEILIMEADTLGMLDTSRIKPTFSKKDREKFLKSVYELRLPRFKHKEAKKIAETLLSEYTRLH